MSKNTMSIVSNEVLESVTADVESVVDFDSLLGLNKIKEVQQAFGKLP
jgi:hypothetical protein